MDTPGKAAAEQPPAQEEPFPLVESLFILMLAGFVGFEVIGRVSPLLHTPLMAATNAISGISLVGSLVIAGSAEFPGAAARVLGFVAVTAAMINVVGGFMITDRMLRMFKKKGPGR
jgi:NAD(P) transhydrogenase subunit alpha